MSMSERPTHTHFANTRCEYFPCHIGIAREDFNCLFCYCPLYTLGTRCGGSFTYTDRGIKNCKNCTLPHEADAYSRITERFPELSRLASENKE